MLLRSPWMLALVLDQSLFLHSLDRFELAAVTDRVCETRATGLAALTARFLLTSWKAGQPSCTEVKAAGENESTDDNDDNHDDDDEDDADVTAAAGNSDVSSADKTNNKNEINSLYLEMLMDIALAVVYIQASQAYVSQQPLPQQELEQDFCNLIGQLSSAEAERLICCVMERSLTNGEAWSVVLDVILRQLELSGKKFEERWSATDPEMFVPLTLSAASTLCVILPRMSRNTCVDVAEITVAILMTCDVNKLSTYDAAFDSKYATFVISLHR